jgi:voltage-gated potassium channel
VVGFLDLMLREQSQTLRVEELNVPPSSPWIDLPLERLQVSANFNLLVLALKKAADGTHAKLRFNPSPETRVGSGDAIIVMGDVNDIQRARQAAGGLAIPTTTS